jgi:hypothetical protein
MRRRFRRAALLGAIAVWTAVAWHQAHKPLPPGTHVASAVCSIPAGDVAFIADITAADAWGRPAATSGGTEGLPNQPVASELVARSAGAIHVRWYRTHGERFHGALVLICSAQGAWLSAGSAQLTRRSLDDYNLEANVAIEVSRAAPLAQRAQEYFDTLWGNRAALGIEYTAEFAAFANPAQSDYWLYRLMEGAGFASF